MPSGFNLKVYVYEASLKANSVLKKYYSKIFLEGCKYPEDLCFFHEKKLLLGTVSHEKICYLYPIDKAMESRFQQLGLWKEKKYLQEEHITLVL